MSVILHTYRKVILGCLFSIFLANHMSWATSDQDMTGLTAQSLGSGLGDAAPASAYNSSANEYLVVFAKTDADCTNERLFGQVINALTGELVDTAFPISDCNISIKNPAILYNPSLDEYIVFYKSLGIIGDKSNLYYCSIDGTTKEINLSPTQLIGDGIADPFNNLVLAFDSQTNTYALGYHKSNASSESTLNINYLDASSKSIQAFETYIDKSTFTDANTGIFHTQILFNGSSLSLIFELRLDTGAEIWGGNINSSSGLIIDDYFQISPDAVSGTDPIYYTNPSAIYSSSSNEIVTSYEESYFSDAGEAYILSQEIRIQKINSQTGELSGPTNVAIPALPGSGNTEDKKNPKILLSALSNEVIMTYYGVRFVAGTDTYNLYLHRFTTDNLTSLNTTSIAVASGIGNQVLLNNTAKPLAFSHNDINNQFNLTWMVESTLELKSQIWRYDNNPPSNLALSNTAQNENFPVGSTFGTLSASDPDPEDSSPTFTLISGTGGEDNTEFTIEGNTLKNARILNFEEKSTRSIKVRATDSHDAVTDKTILLTINDLNEAPEDISLTEPLSIVENSATFTSTITVVDEDIDDSFSLSLVAGDSSDNNANFRITNDNILELITPLDFEDTSKQYVRLRATDAIGLPKEKAFTIQVTDINEPMDTMYVSPGEIPENDANAFVLVEIEDPDQDSNYTITLTEGDGDDDNSFFNPVDNKLKLITAADFEIKDSYQVRVKAQEGNYEKSQSMTIYVTDVNDVPDSITISSKTIMDGRGAGFAIGKILTYDQDDGDEHQLSLIQGSDIFLIDTNDSLLTKIALAYNYSVPSANFYTIELQTKDKAGAITTQTFIIEVVPFSDTELPIIYDVDKNQKYFPDNVQNVSLSISTSDNEKLDTTYFYYRKIRADESFLASESVNQIETNEKFFRVEVDIPYSDLDEMGIEYYFKVVDAAGNSDSTEIYYAYRSYASLTFDPTKGVFKGDLNSYKIITNPYQLESSKVSKIFADYGSSNSDSWRLFKYENQKNIEIGNNTSSSITQGTGYWFNKAPIIDQSITFENAKVPENNRTNEYILSLRSGWNLIGNPYPFAVNWNQVLTENGYETDDIILNTYHGDYSESIRLNEFEGAFVFMENASDIVVPILSNPEFARISNQDNPEFDWFVNITLENSQQVNNRSGIGMHANASISYDKYDRPLLPRFISQPEILFEHPEHLANAFSRDIVTSDDQYIWEFTALDNSNKEIHQLSWNDPEFSDQNKALVLYDINHEKAIDMTSSSTYSFELNAQTAFKVIYGDQSFIDAQFTGIRIEALQPYPNPFNQEVMLPINLPASNNEYQIECNIFNLLGDKVYQKSENRNGNETYAIQWRDHQDLEKGIYIYSIKVKNQFLTKEFHGRIVKN